MSNYSSNVLLSGVTTDGAWRNGLSVISAINLTVVDSVFKNTNGTNPQCGIDLEPDFPTDKLQGIGAWKESSRLAWDSCSSCVCP